MPVDMLICCELSYEGFGSFDLFYDRLPADQTLACYDYLNFRRGIEAKKNEWMTSKMREISG